MKDRKGRCVFGAHYDEGRICGAIGDIEFQKLTRRSSDIFRNIEQMAGKYDTFAV